MGPNARQLSVKFEAIFVSKQYDFSPNVSCQLGQNQIQGLSVVSKTSLSVVSGKYR